MKKQKFYKAISRNIEIPNIEEFDKYDGYENYRKFVVQICDERDEIIYQQIIKDMRENPEKYDYDFAVITRERINDLIKKGLEYEKRTNN